MLVCENSATPGADQATGGSNGTNNMRMGQLQW